MSDARTEILEKIRAVKPAGFGDRATAWQHVERDFLTGSQLGRDEILHLLEDRLLDYDATVLRCAPDAIAVEVQALLEKRGKAKMAIPEGLEASWLPQGFEFVVDHQLPYDQLDKVDGVITGCTVAIADTGSIVVRNTAGQGRRAITLVPDYHLCVVFASAVVKTVPEAMRQLQPYNTSPITFFSGPSATADIEMTRIKGVHGPRFLDVVLVLD
ncbi:LutC/YkgG family protein [Terriglobus tenax]|uniref:LutC/YkgG family protein n=1 Tax=Terriglobus tenax TaxID=1111115 RepID=UPI0021DF94AA|nr:LUD domain-containing protein [Terriglobus tenax]